MNQRYKNVAGGLTSPLEDPMALGSILMPGTLSKCIPPNLSVVSDIQYTRTL